LLIMMIYSTSLFSSAHIFFFFFQYYATLLDLHSFPTRRSSDLFCWYLGSSKQVFVEDRILIAAHPLTVSDLKIASPNLCKVGGRSEEHTSELQSRENLVCRLLLEKKK